jgi:parallel beta-helix repeat protein
MKKILLPVVLFLCVTMQIGPNASLAAGDSFQIPSSNAAPFGEFSTPIDGSTVRSSIPVTGWALDDKGAASVKIYREDGNTLVYIGDAVFVEGARPDVEAAYPQLHILMGTGINTFECTDCTIRSNQSHENIGGGILVEDGVNVLVEGNNVYDNDLDAWVDEWWDGGLWVDGGHDIIIRNNTFTGNSRKNIWISAWE